jgi:hypothetical protein
LAENIPEAAKQDQEKPKPTTKKPLLKKIRRYRLPIIFITLMMISGLLFSFMYSAYQNYFTDIKEVTIPNIVGMQEEFALTILKDLELEGVLIGEKESLVITPNTILESKPEAGSRVKSNRNIQYIISKQKKIVMVPNLTGLNIIQAQQVITENHLAFADSAYQYSENVEIEKVISQTPASDSYVSINSTITLTVSKGVPINIFIEEIGPELEHLSVKVKFSIPEGWNKRRIKIVSSGKDYDETIYSQLHEEKDIMLIEFEEIADNKIQVFYDQAMLIEKKIELAPVKPNGSR